MSLLRKILAHLALMRSDEALIKASGGVARTVREMTLEPRLQYIEAKARARGTDWNTLSPEALRAQTDALADIFGGGSVSRVRVERIYITGRSHSVPGLLYLPFVRDNSAAMMVYYHFGGGVIGSPKACHRLCGLIAKETGAPVLSVDYRLAPEHKFPAGLEDAHAAYAWAIENAARFGAPGGKAAVGGDSMGGNFAAIIAQETRSAHAPVLQLLIYPAVDFVTDAPSMHEFADAFPLTAEAVEFFLRHYLPLGFDPVDPRVSPARAGDLSGLAPALIYAAGFDMLLDQVEAYAAQLREAGVAVQCARFETLPHGFVSMASAAPAVEAALRRIAQETASAIKELS